MISMFHTKNYLLFNYSTVVFGQFVSVIEELHKVQETHTTQ